MTSVAEFVAAGDRAFVAEEWNEAIEAYSKVCLHSTQKLAAHVAACMLWAGGQAASCHASCRH